MSVGTEVAGYPVHRVEWFMRWTNGHRVDFTDWGAACGASGTLSGHAAFKLAGSARRAELCRSCFPSRDWGGHFPPPEQRYPAAG